MKNIKLTILSFLLVVFAFTSCTNNEDPITEPQNISESESITTALNELGYRFNDDGSLNSENNPSNNIIFDFCFDFVYPIDLSYNTGATVTINSLEDIIEVLINSSDDLYINGIAFPFNVETYDEATGTIVVLTINNENDFIELIESCDFDNGNDCICTEEYMPVCVEIETGSDEEFIITFPNACYAECEGFTQDDFLEECIDEDYNGPDDDECFNFVFPLSIITDSGEVITISSEEELDVALYNVYAFDFVYPFDIMMNDTTGVIVTINNETEFYEILDDCYDYWDDDCEDCEFIDGPEVCVNIQTGTGQVITYTFPNACYAECEGFTQEDFVECDNSGGGNNCNCTDEFDPVCVEIDNGIGGAIIVSFPNACYAECEGFTEDNFIECDNTGGGDDCNCTAEVNPVCVEFTDPFTGNVITATFLNECYALCEGFTIDNFVDCENTNPSSCNEQEIFTYLLQCEWYINTSLYDTFNAEYVQFFQDGSLEIFSEGSNDGVSGTWDLASNPASGEIFMFFDIATSPHDLISQLDWTVTECSEEYIMLSSGNEYIILERDCN